MSKLRVLHEKTPPIGQIAYDTYNEMLYAINAVATEVAFYAHLSVSEDNVWLVHGPIRIPEQTVTSVDADIEPEQEAKMREDMMDEDEELSDLLVHCHSHVDMPVKPSADDEVTIQKFLSNYSDGEKMVRIIINKKQEIRFDAIDLGLNLVWENLSVAIVYTNTDRIKALKKQLKHVKVATNSTQYGWQGSRVGGWQGRGRGLSGYIGQVDTSPDPFVDEIYDEDMDEEYAEAISYLELGITHSLSELELWGEHLAAFDSDLISLGKGLARGDSLFLDAYQELSEVALLGIAQGIVVGIHDVDPESRCKTWLDEVLEDSQLTVVGDGLLSVVETHIEFAGYEKNIARIRSVWDYGFSLGRDCGKTIAEGGSVDVLAEKGLRNLRHEIPILLFGEVIGTGVLVEHEEAYKRLNEKGVMGDLTPTKTLLEASSEDGAGWLFTGFEVLRFNECKAT